MTKPRPQVTSQPLRSRPLAGTHAVSERALAHELEQQLRTALIFRIANWPADRLIVGPGGKWPEYDVSRLDAPMTAGELYLARRLFGDAALRTIRSRTASPEVRRFVDRALALPAIGSGP